MGNRAIFGYLRMHFATQAKNGIYAAGRVSDYRYGARMLIKFRHIIHHMSNFTIDMRLPWSDFIRFKAA